MDRRFLEWLDLVLDEDIGDGDHSTLACVPEGAIGNAHLLVKETGILAGVDAVSEIFKYFDSNLKMKVLITDGSIVRPGDIAFRLSGNSRSILTIERTVLNIMQRLSGIATHTKHLVDLIAHTDAKLLDTRKTTPGMRQLEKEAVLKGGGYNHRMGLYDMVMLKDNHIDYAGGIAKALVQTRKYLAEKELDLRIEVEARNIQEVKEILETGVPDRIMLDNFSIASTIEALQLIDGKCETEASGGITQETIVKIAETGVDFISVGALTHSVKSLDLSLKATYNID